MLYMEEENWNKKASVRKMGVGYTTKKRGSHRIKVKAENKTNG